MSLTWFEEYAKKADEMEAKRKEEWMNNVIRPPTPGTDIQVSVSVVKEPLQRTITGKNGKLFVVYSLDTLDGKPFEMFESLYFAIVRALAKKAAKIQSDNCSHVLLHIQNVGEGRKDKWVVIPLVGV